MVIRAMTEQRLRTEIAFLEGILSETVEQLAGEKTINRVQLLRELADARRQGVPGAEQEMVAAVDSIPLERIEDLIRAFGFYFDLANLAEDRHRVRVLREREREGELADKPRPESIEFAVAEMSRIQMSAESVQQLLDRLLVEPVFTAHPTEAKRKSLREKIRDLREHLHELDGVNLTERERNRLIRELSTDLAVLWQTDLLRERRPTVLEELERSLFFFETLWRVVPELYRDLTEALDRYYPEHRFSIPSFLRFGTWIGGDRDGNPNWTAPQSGFELSASAWGFWTYWS
jgi:phosphoenolpyruvate carboxylase